MSNVDNEKVDRAIATGKFEKLLKKLDATLEWLIFSPRVVNFAVIAILVIFDVANEEEDEEPTKEIEESCMMFSLD